MFKYCSCGGFAQGDKPPDNCPFCNQQMRTFGTLAEAEEANRIDNRAGMPGSMIEAMNIALYNEPDPFKKDEPPQWPDELPLDARMI